VDGQFVLAAQVFIVLLHRVVISSGIWRRWMTEFLARGKHISRAENLCWDSSAQTFIFKVVFYFFSNVILFFATGHVVQPHTFEATNSITIYEPEMKIE
jgi:hypothetical protein